LRNELHRLFALAILQVDVTNSPPKIAMRAVRRSSPVHQFRSFQLARLKKHVCRDFTSYFHHQLSNTFMKTTKSPCSFIAPEELFFIGLPPVTTIPRSRNTARRSVALDSLNHEPETTTPDRLTFFNVGVVT
jgi:hypothetical protein